VDLVLTETATGLQTTKAYACTDGEVRLGSTAQPDTGTGLLHDGPYTGQLVLLKNGVQVGQSAVFAFTLDKSFDPLSQIEIDITGM
jgi:hypothetical protein